MTTATDVPDGHRWLSRVRGSVRDHVRGRTPVSPRTLRLLRPLGCAVLAGVVLWPFVVAVVAGWGGASGPALLLRDMSVPGSMVLNDLARGTDGVARAVPQDAVLAVLSPLVPPPVTVGLLMLVAGTVGAVGASLLARRSGAGAAGQSLAALVVLWNPYLAERLLQGHWSVVAAGMLLPAVALMAAPTGAGCPARRTLVLRAVALVALLAVCALTPTGLVLGAVTALVASGWRRATWIPLVAAVLLSLPWVVPSVGDASATLSDSHGADLFAARAEPLVGTLGALAGLGGIWNADAVPAHRVPVAGVLLALAAVTVAVVLWRRGRWTGTLRRLSWLAVAAVLLPAVAATGPGLAVLGELLEILPGAGLLRDTQKFVVLALPALAVLLARVGVLWPRGGSDRPAGASSAPAPAAATVPVALAAVLAVVQVPALPADLSDLRPVSPDARYAEAVDAVEDAAAQSGTDRPRTLLWPPGNYRVIEGRPVLDPLLKMLPGAPVDPGYLIVDGRLVDGDPDTVRLLSSLAEGTHGADGADGTDSPSGTAGSTGTAGTADPEDTDGLAEAGIDFVLVEGTGADAATVPPVPAALTDPASPHELVWSADGWALYRVR